MQSRSNPDVTESLAPNRPWELPRWFGSSIVAVAIVLGSILVTKYRQAAENPTVFITRTGSHYHLSHCQHLAKSRIPISLEDAIAKGQIPCSYCKPPTLSEPNEDFDGGW